MLCCPCLAVVCVVLSLFAVLFVFVHVLFALRGGASWRGHALIGAAQPHATLVAFGGVSRNSNMYLRMEARAAARLGP